MPPPLALRLILGGLVPRKSTRERNAPSAHRVEDLAAEWNISPDSIREGLRTGRIKGFRINRLWLISEAEKARIERGEAAT